MPTLADEISELNLLNRAVLDVEESIMNLHWDHDPHPDPYTEQLCRFSNDLCDEVRKLVFKRANDQGIIWSRDLESFISN